jgi:MFS superfamily sulfate permease-like transporter
LFQGFSIGSSLSKSAANDRAGAKTPVALIVCALMTILVALFFTPLFEPLPEAVLAAVVVVAITGMIKVKVIRRLYRLNRLDFALAIVAIFGVLTFEALEGLMVAVILSLLALVWRASQAKLSVLGPEPGRFTLSDTRRHPENRTIPGLLILRPDEGLFFANANDLRNEIIKLVDNVQPPVKVALLDLEMSNQLDVPTIDMLVELKEELEHRNVELWLARLHGPVRDALERSNILNEIGPDKIHPRSLDSILEYLSQLSPDEYEDIVFVNDGIKMIIDVVDILLPHSTGKQRETLESYHEKLVEILRAIESDSSIQNL